jgi:hypothetical protein
MKKIINITAASIQQELFYVTPTIQLDLKPMNGHKLHIKVYIFGWMIQIEFRRKNPNKLGEQFLA